MKTWKKDGNETRKQWAKDDTIRNKMEIRKKTERKN